MRIAVYGGSFNPPHRAHGLVAEWVVQSGAVDAVWLVPVFRHAFEGVHGKRLATFEQRVQWCEALAKDLSVPVIVSRVESELAVPSYSIDTLDHLASQFPDHRFNLVVGADILDAVDGWKAWGRIQKEYAPIVVGREGYTEPEGAPVFPDVSSTDIRERCALGAPIDGLVSPSVAALLEGAQPWTQ
jgi:nicotinate-nucleotide adenylyltransferase